MVSQIADRRRRIGVADQRDGKPASRSQTPAFSVVLEQHGSALLAFCRAQAGFHRGEDVFQEMMIAALRAYDTVRDPDAVKSWLFSIAARKAIDAHRAAGRSAIPIADPELPDAPVAPVDGDIWEQVAGLPDKQRQAVTLRFMADLTHREIAEVMQISEPAVRRNVFEGLRRLRHELDPDARSRPPITRQRSFS